ncbi:MAG: hypothetical protein EP319_02440 [Deltaproteobacteria bacterium]|nr:MAG: hypothetical protein EP319_02440 [Deltaproteobacteria bacterium]
MWKKIKLLFLTLLTILVVLFAYKYKITPTQIIPYPYLMNVKNIEGSLEAASSNVLIVGDRMGVALDKYIPELIKDTSAELKDPLKIYNWSRSNEGLHRSIDKLKKLDALPSVVIFHGASEEFYEKKFYISQKDIIMKNMALYEDDAILTMIMTAPFISKYLYTPIKYIVLGDYPKQDSSTYTGKQKQDRLEIAFKIFEKEVIELIQYVKSKDSKLIIMTTPINLETEPKSVCENAKTQTMEDYQKDIELMISEGNKKKAYLKAKELAKISLTNAKSHYLYGKVSLDLGRFKEAREQLTMAAAYDCTQWRINIVFNKILEKIAKRNNVELVDFDMLVNQNLGRDTLFLDPIFPQVIYYQRALNEIKKLIRKSFNL